MGEYEKLVIEMCNAMTRLKVACLKAIKNNIVDDTRSYMERFGSSLLHKFIIVKFYFVFKFLS